MALISLLDACLVAGYGNQTPTAITRVGSVATVTKAGHGYQKHNRITQTGWDQPEYNGEFRVESVVDVNTYTINVSGTPTTPGTGATPSVRKSGAGWTKPFTGTNLAAFKQPASLTNPVYFRFDDTTTTYATFRGYEAMTAIGTGTGEFPTTAQRSIALGVNKSGSADTSARTWVLVVSEGTVYFWSANTTASDGSTGYMIMFGDFVSYKTGDAWNKFAIGTGWNGSSINITPTYNYAANLNSYIYSTGIYDHYIARSYTQSGACINMCKVSDYAKSYGQAAMGSSAGAYGNMAYPHPIDGGLYLANLWLAEPYQTNALLRGEMVGIWNPLHYQPLSHYDTFSGVGGLAGKEFMALRGAPSANNTSYGCQYFLEISDTW